MTESKYSAVTPRIIFDLYCTENRIEGSDILSGQNLYSLHI